MEEQKLKVDGLKVIHNDLVREYIKVCGESRKSMKERGIEKYREYLAEVEKAKTSLADEEFKKWLETNISIEEPHCGSEGCTSCVMRDLIEKIEKSFNDYNVEKLTLLNMRMEEIYQKDGELDELREVMEEIFKVRQNLPKPVENDSDSSNLESSDIFDNYDIID